MQPSQSDLFEQKYAGKNWRELEFVGFDTETTGKYPLQAEVCEVAAVKWKDGKIVATFETLLKPTQPMDAEVIAIHHITNEMVESAPRMQEKIAEFRDFIGEAIPVAHHAPFDLGFLSLDFEANAIGLPEAPVVCSSLLSRKLFPESDNHRLQTLIKFFALEQGKAHRALDDARACLEVGLRCFEKLGDLPITAAFEAQGGALTWQRFSMRELEAHAVTSQLIRAIREHKIIEMTYSSGSSPGEKRRVHPLGLVRSLDGDFVVAYAEKDQRSKRYFVDKVSSVEFV